MAEEIYLRGGGLDKALRDQGQDIPSVFQPIVDKANDILDGVDEVIDDLSPVVEHVADGIDDPYSNAPEDQITEQARINGQWLVENLRDWNQVPVVQFLHMNDLLQISEFPYIVASGSMVKLHGKPSDDWLEGRDSLYNSATGLVYKVREDWLISVYRVRSATEPSYSNVITDEARETGWERESTRKNGNSQRELTGILDRISNTHRTVHERLERPARWADHRARSGSSNRGDIVDRLLGRLNDFLPTAKLAKLMAAIAALNALKDSTICFLQCSIKNTVDLARDLAGVVGSVSDGSFSFPVQITTPDIATLTNCFNLDWLFEMLRRLIQGVIAAIMGVIALLKGIVDALKGLMSWPECNCAGLGMGDFGLDICGLGFQTERTPVASSSELGPLDYAVRSRAESVQEQIDYKTKREWRPNWA